MRVGDHVRHYSGGWMFGVVRCFRHDEASGLLYATVHFPRYVARHGGYPEQEREIAEFLLSRCEPAPVPPAPVPPAPVPPAPVPPAPVPPAPLDPLVALHREAGYIRRDRRDPSNSAVVFVGKKSDVNWAAVLLAKRGFTATVPAPRRRLWFVEVRGEEAVERFIALVR